MKKITLFTASMFALFAIASCNKSKVTQTIETKNSNVNENKKWVEEKTYNLSLEQIKSSIHFLKAKSDPNQSNAKQFKPESNLDPEYSIFVIEAALNSEFDKDPKDHEVFQEAIEFSAPLTFVNGDPFVSPTDLINTYDQFSSFIKEISKGPKKIKIIDITAIMDPVAGQIIYKGSVILFAGAGSQVTCNPFAGGYVAKFSVALWGPYCSTYSLPDGPTAVATKLNNCYRFLPQCNNNYSWINVNTQVFYAAASTLPINFYPTPATNLGVSSGGLWYYLISAPGNPCYIFGGSQLNSQVLTCNGIAASNTPLGKHVSNQFVSAWYNSVSYGTYIEWGWANYVTYGSPVCNISDQ